jgi:hypothetical protein
VARAGEEALEAVKLGPVLQRWLGVGVRAAASAGAQASVAAAQRGDVKTAAELGAAGPVAEAFAGPLAKALTESLPERLINSLIKPGVRDFEFGKVPAAGITDERITAGSLNSLAEKVTARKHEVGRVIDQVLSRPDVAANAIDNAPLIHGPIDEAVRAAAQDGNQALVDRLEGLRQGLTTEFDIEGGKVVSKGPKPLVLSPLDPALLKRDIGASVKWREGDAFNTDINRVKV